MKSSSILLVASLLFVATAAVATAAEQSGDNEAGSVTVAAQVGTVTYGTGGSAQYEVTVKRGSKPGAFAATMSVTSALPAGVTTSFVPNPVSFRPQDDSKKTTLTVTSTGTMPAGTTTITVKAADDKSNPRVRARGNGTLSVAKAAALLVTADDQAKAYGGSEPTLTYTASGTLYYNDTYGVISGVTLATAAAANATAGTHPITASGGMSANYEVTHASGTLAVAKAAALTATADNKAKTYGGPEPPLTFTASGTLYYNDTYGVISGVMLATSAAANATAGAHPITASGGMSANYEVSHAPGTLTVAKAAALTATADNKAKTYGGPEPTLTFTASGTLYYGDTYGVISGVTLAAAAAANATAGTHPITASGGMSANYEVTHAPGTLTVDKAPLILTADNKAKTYGGPEPPLTFTVSGALYYNDTYGVISGVTLATATGANATAGTHPITASGGVSANYEVTHALGTLAVAKAAALTVTVDDKAKTYGGPEPTLTYAASGTLYYGDTYAVISGVRLATRTGARATAGRHPIRVGGGRADNYQVTHALGTLTVAKAAALTATADDKAKVYGGPEPTLTLTGSGALYYGDTYAVISGVTLATAAGAQATAGTHEIMASGGISANYEVTHARGTLTVAKAPLIVTADDKAKAYGASEPTLTYTASGALYYGDTYTVISGVRLATRTGAEATAGRHAIRAGGGRADNYEITTANGTLAVAKAAPLTVTADDKAKTYGGPEPTLTYAASGTLYYGDTYAVISGVRLATRTQAEATAGTHPIRVDGGGADNYEITHANGILTVAKAAALTATADDKAKVYGGPEPTLTFTGSGALHYGDTYAVISGVRLSTRVGAEATAGTHPIRAGGGRADNYEVATANGALTVAKAPLIVTADDKAKAYGGSEPTLTYTVSGALYYGDTYAVISGVRLATRTGAEATAGRHAIRAGGGRADNYGITTADGALTVAKAAPLTVTADDKAKTYGGPEPTLTYAASGTLYYNDTYAVIGGVSLVTRTGAEAAAGRHPIRARNGNAANYEVMHLPGQLTVAKAAPLTVTAVDKAKSYGGDEPALTYTASGTLYYGDTYAVISGVALATKAGAQAAAGTHEITVTGGTAANYEVEHQPGRLTVAKAAALTVTADDKAKVYGGDEPALTYTASGTLYYGDTYAVISGVALATKAGAQAAAGTHEITVTGGMTANYEVATANGTLSVAKAALTVKPDDKAKSYGGDEPALTYTASGTLYYGDTYAVISGVALATKAGAQAAAGTHEITATGGIAANYQVAAVNGTLTVAKAAPLLATADNKSKTYGGPEPTLTYTGSGTLYYGDTYAVISDVVLATRTAAQATAGTHEITATGGTAANYGVTHLPGTLTVAKATALAVTADDKRKTYGGNEPPLTSTASGTLYYGDTYAVISGVALATRTGAQATAGTHRITAAGGTAANYVVTHVPGTLTVAKAPLTMIADNKSKVYGGDEPTLTCTESGTLYYGDTYAAITGEVATTMTGAAATAGTHPITVSGGRADNYEVRHLPGTLTVAKASLTITPKPATKAFGCIHTFGGMECTESGLKYDDAVASVTLASTGCGASATVGAHPITACDAVGTRLENYTITYLEAVLTVTHAPATATLAFTSEPQQYSDFVQFTATVANGYLAGLQAADALTVRIGTQVMGTITLAPSGSNLTGTLSVALLEGSTPTGQMAPGTHAVTCEPGPVNSNFTLTPPVTGTLTIAPEAARTIYAGAMFVATSGTGSSRATVTLNATIQDITATREAAGDVSFGDIRNATVTFVDRDNAGAVIATVPVSLLSPTDTKTGTATYDWSVNLGSGDAKVFTVGVVVGNYYARNSSYENTVVAVSKPLGGLITGGARLVLANSSGIRAGDAGTRNDIGFYVKFDNGGDDPTGKVNTIVRSGGRVFQVKGNRMTSLTVRPTEAGGTATFKGKASIQDITEPLVPIMLDGNATLQVLVADLGEPGTADSLALAVWDRNGGLWFASNWSDSKLTKQVLDGGNVEVKGNGRDAPLAPVASAMISDPMATAIPLQYAFPQNFPNPFSATTTLRFELPRQSRVTLTVYDLMGREVARLVDQVVEPGFHTATWSGRNSQGDPLGAGVYFVRIVATSLTGSDGLRTDRRAILVK